MTTRIYPVNVVSCGLTTPLGFSSDASMAAARAGISGIGELNYADEAGMAIMGARIPGLDDERSQSLRLLKMLVRSIGECVNVMPNADLAATPLLLAISDDDHPGIAKGFRRYILDAIAREFNIKSCCPNSEVFPFGHAGGFCAVARAAEILASKKYDRCVVCGVDSFVRASSLLWLEETNRLKTEGESVGVVPGEAAAALLLEPLKVTAGINPVLRVCGIGFADEPVGPISEEPLRGHGLAQALTEALSIAEIEAHELDFRLSDINGEPYGFMEQSLAISRVLRQVRDAIPLWHPAEFLGDTGAAAGLIQLVLAAHSFDKDYAPGPIGACFTSSFGGRRAVAIVSSPDACRS